MSNISFFFPKQMQGLALGLNAGLGNAGVSVMQFLIPWVITFGMFGALGGEPQELGPDNQVWIQNAALVWVPILTFLAILAWVFMNNLPQHDCGPTPVAIGKYLWLQAIGFLGRRVGVVLLIFVRLPIPELVRIFLVVAAAVAVTLLLMKFMTPKTIQEPLNKQFAIFSNKHNWVMTWLYVMTFGSFIGYAIAFPKLIDDIFVTTDERTGDRQLHLDRRSRRRLHSTGRRLAVRQARRRTSHSMGHLDHGWLDDRWRDTSCR